MINGDFMTRVYSASSVAAAALGLALLMPAADALAQSESAWNPKPDKAADIVLPMPGTYRMVFVRVPVPGKGPGRDYYGGTERIFELGSDKSRPEPFEAPRLARVGGNFQTRDSDWYMAVGKYEVTIGQYAALLGDGDIQKGIALLAENSAIETLKKGADGEAVKADQRMLARPLHGLSAFDYQDFIAKYNVWCLSEKSCIDAMRTQLGKVGFFRLPMEHEWEYVARDGQSGMGSSQPLPFSSGDIQTYANVASKSRLPEEIGKRSPLPHLPIYDIYGNVAEMMATPFAMDNGSGTVGGLVVRGGGFQTGTSVVRRSYREEISPFAFRSSDNSYSVRRDRSVGIRLMIGATVRIHEGSDTAFRDISSEFTTGYVSIGGDKPASSLCGPSLLKARYVGIAQNKKPLEIADGVSPEQRSGFCRFDIKQFGKLDVSLTSVTGDSVLEIKHPSWETARTLNATSGKTGAVSIPDVLPGSMWFKATSSRASEAANFRVKLDFHLTDSAGNLSGEARNLGLLSETFPPIDDYVGEDDVNDYYKFSIDRSDTLSIALLGMTADANVELLDDQQRKLAEGINPGSSPEKISLEKAKAGTYYVRVYTKDNAPTKYRLLVGLGNVDTAGDTIASARDLGSLVSQAVDINEALSGTDKADFYKFAVTQPSSVKIQVNKMSTNLLVELIAGSGKTLITLNKPTGNEDFIDTALDTGTYYVAVKNQTRATTTYAMNVDVRPYKPYTHRDMPYHFKSITTTPTEFRTTIDNEATLRFLQFDVTTPATYRFSLEMVRVDRGVDVDLRLQRSPGPGQWNDVAISQNKSGENEEIVRQLEPGKYQIIIIRDWREALGTAEVVLKTSLSRGMIEPTFGAMEDVGTFDDWKATMATTDGKKRCFVRTVATSVSPSDGWRAVRPYILIRVEGGDNRVFHTLDKAEFYRNEQDVVATVTGSTGTFTIPALAARGEPDIKTQEPCRAGSRDLCVSSDGLRGLTRGRELTLTGTTRDGQRGTVVYSLRGYTQAVQAMNNACGNQRSTDWLIKK